MVVVAAAVLGFLAEDGAAAVSAGRLAEQDTPRVTSALRRLAGILAPCWFAIPTSLSDLARGGTTTSQLVPRWRGTDAALSAIAKRYKIDEINKISYLLSDLI